MTENINPINSYSHADIIRMRDAVVKSCGTEYDPIILLCSYLQHAVDKQTFNNMITLLEMSELELQKLFGVK